MITPYSVSTIIALALRFLIGDPVDLFLLFSTFLKKTERESVYVGVSESLDCSLKIRSQNLRPI